MKFIVDIRDDIDANIALGALSAVIAKGRISKGRNGIDQYCWITTFEGNVTVSAREKRKRFAVDSFVVHRTDKRIDDE